MSKGHKIKRIYNQRMRRIAPFVVFKFDRRHNLDTFLTPSQKSQITKYYKYLNNITRKPYSYYKPRYYLTRNKADISTVFKATNNPLKQLRIIPVDTKGSITDKIIVKKHKVKGKIIRTLEIEQKIEGQKRLYDYESFNMAELARKPETYLKNLMDKFPANYRFIIKCGNFRHHQTSIKNIFIKNIIEFMEKYPNWTKWMTGFIIVRSKKKSVNKPYA
jgi:hypothetical protein